MLRASNLFGRALRETGQALDRLGLVIAQNELFKDTFSRHRSIMNLFDKRPVIAAGVFVAPNASVIGEVLLLNKVSIWYGAVLRADKNKIKIGNNSNVQDRAVINTVTSLDSGFPSEVDIGDNVTIGHGALITSSIIGDNAVIGQGAIIQEGSDIGSNTIIAPGSVILPGTLVPSGQLWAGNPAVYIRAVSEEEVSSSEKSASNYADLASQHSEEFLPYGTVYQQAEKL